MVSFKQHTCFPILIQWSTVIRIAKTMMATRITKTMTLTAMETGSYTSMAMYGNSLVAQGQGHCCSSTQQVAVSGMIVDQLATRGQIETTWL